MSDYTMPPCKANKCIAYPICLSKTEIECQLLADFYGMASDQTYESGADIWNVIQEALPKLQEIHGPRLTKGGLIYRAFNIYKYPDPGYFNPGDKIS